MRRAGRARPAVGDGPAQRVAPRHPDHGRLDPRTPATALELAARIHPTPAVGGNPTAAAVRYLQAVEGFDRGRYAGPVGWVDARGDGAWAIGIRSAEVDGAHASIFAGNGVVKGPTRPTS